MYRPSGYIGDSTFYDVKYVNGKMDFRGCSWSKWQDYFTIEYYMDFIYYTQLLDFEIEDAFPNLTADDIAAISAQGANGLLYNEQNVVYIGQIDNAYPNYIVKLKLMDPNFNNGGV